MIHWLAPGLGLAVVAIGYGTLVGMAWLRYGHVAPPSRGEHDALLDRFMPEYDVAERHHVRVAAGAPLALSAAAEVDLQRSRMVRAIFRAREVVLGAEPDAQPRPAGLLAQTTSLGWRVLAEMPGREIVVGAVTQPWLADVVFRGLSPEEFPRFREPGYVKIAWTLRADAIDASTSVLRTETRVMATDPTARAKFRWYWSRFSPGIILIRRVMLHQLQKDAERRARAAEHGPS